MTNSHPIHTQSIYTKNTTVSLGAVFLFLATILPSPHAQADGFFQQPTQTLPTAVKNELPLRNLRVEVRQLRNQASVGSDYQANGRIILQPGNSRGSFGFGASDNSGVQNRNFSQNALVLNGRKVRFHIGNEQPLRVVQAYARHGSIAVVPSTVFIQKNSGFYAQPVWYGGRDVEIEIGAMLSNLDPYAVQKLEKQQSSTTSTVSVPLGEWTTIAESQDQQYDDSRGTLHKRNRTRTGNMRVQMRVSVQ